MSKEFNKFYLVSFTSEFARTIPHAFLILYLLKSNITISQISLIQIVYMIAIILFEIPSGVLADRVSKKWLYFISCILMMFSYLLYINIISVVPILIAHGLYGISSAFQTGTIDALILNTINDNEIGEDNKKRKISEFFRKSELILTVGMIIGSSVGSYLFYSLLGSNVYVLAIILFGVSGFVSLLMIEKSNTKDKNHNISHGFYKGCLTHFKEGIKQLTFNKKLLLLITSLALLQFILQPFFNYWQPISVLKGINERYMGFIYVMMQAFAILGTYFYKFMIEKNKAKKMNIIALVIVMVLLLTFALLISNSYIYISLLF